MAVETRKGRGWRAGAKVRASQKRFAKNRSKPLHVCLEAGRLDESHAGEMRFRLEPTPEPVSGSAEVLQVSIVQG